MKNLFIVLDGIDGCGKSTQLTLLHGYLFRKDKRFRILSTREPTYGTYGSKIREMLKAHKDPYSDSGKLLDLYVKDRKEHLESAIEPFLSQKGGNISIVLCDRYYYSTISYQAAQGIEVEKAVAMNRGFLKPDIAIILDVDEKTAISRIRVNRQIEKFEDVEFMSKLRHNFLSMKNILNDKIALIETSGTREETAMKIRKEIDKFL
ncbi:dTMP kinase [Candidatus Woesearchaeota archaeon]|nr:dTMP kinase [Candidatus Woesearchaeota archaeon]